LVRDDVGDVVVSGRGRVDHLLNAFHDELVACVQGIQTAVDLGIGHPIIETDAKLAVQAITTNDFDEAAVGLFIAEIKSLVSSAFLALSACLKVENVIKLLTS
jgi:ribonuclease HI